MIYNLPRKKKAAIQAVGIHATEVSDVSQIKSQWIFDYSGNLVDSYVFEVELDDEWIENSTHLVPTGEAAEYIFTFDQNNDALDIILESLNLQNAEDLYENYDCAIVCLFIADSYDPTREYLMAIQISNIIFGENVNYPYFFVTKGEKQSNGKYEESIAFTGVTGSGDENGNMNVVMSEINVDNGFYLVVIYPKQ